MQIRHFALIAATATLFSCGSREEAERAAAGSPSPEEILANATMTHGPPIEEVELTNPLIEEWVSKGKASYEMKCLACHRLTGERVVGPGFAGVTQRRTPVWIMNMITNVDLMLDTDEEAQKLLELCLVRMPNQNVGKEEARAILEFMRSNDGEQ